MPIVVDKTVNDPAVFGFGDSRHPGLTLPLVGVVTALFVTIALLVVAWVVTVHLVEVREVVTEDTVFTRAERHVQDLQRHWITVLMAPPEAREAAFEHLGQRALALAPIGAGLDEQHEALLGTIRRAAALDAEYRSLRTAIAAQRGAALEVLEALLGALTAPLAPAYSPALWETWQALQALLLSLPDTALDAVTLHARFGSLHQELSRTYRAAVTDDRALSGLLVALGERDRLFERLGRYQETRQRREQAFSRLNGLLDEWQAQVAANLPPDGAQRLARVDALLAKVTAAGLGAVALLGLLGLLIGFLGYRELVQPLARTSVALDALCGGDTKASIPPSRLRELDALRRSFDNFKLTRLRMDQLADHRERTLRRDAERLEEQVTKRTSELRSSNEQMQKAVMEARDARKEAEGANLAKSEFLANMSHELRTPLNAIIGYSEMLLEDAEDQELHDYLPDLQKIRNAGKHLLQLINDVLDLSKIEAGRMDVYLETFDIRTLVQDVEGIVQPLRAKNNNGLVINCPEDIGQMRSDLTKLRQSLFNLLSNACKFTQEGHIRLDIRATEEKSRPFVEFQVTDTGIGITPEQMSKLFHAFTQAESSTTRKYGGTGLGLAISKRFSQMLGGDISVVSQYSQGSRFLIKLPRYFQSEGLSSSDRSRQQTSTDRESASVAHDVVLVIDDDRRVYDLLHGVLEADGFQLAHAFGGKQGIQLAQEIGPVVIVVDVVMSPMDGWSVLSSLKSDPTLAGVPVVMLSMAENREIGYTIGASQFVTKPFDIEILLRTVNQYRLRDSEPTVLVAEDDNLTRELLFKTLKKDGWLVQLAVNGRDALDKLLTFQPQLILLDLMMPELGGFGVIEELGKREHWRRIPVIVLTAKDITPEDRQRLDSHTGRILRQEPQTRLQMQTEVRRQIRDALGRQPLRFPGAAMER